MIASSAFIACTTFRSWFTTILVISVDLNTVRIAYLNLVPRKTTSKAYQVIRAITTFVLIFFTACRTLNVSDLSQSQSVGPAAYDDMGTVSLIMTWPLAVHAYPTLIRRREEL